MFSISPHFLTATLLISSCLISTIAIANESPAGQRIISIGGSVTEVVYALGQEKRLVARDTTSVYPQAAQELPDVGYMRRLSPEGVLSVEPDLIIAEVGSGPKETIDVLKQASVKFVEIPDGFDSDAIKAKILAVSEALGVEESGEKLAQVVDTQLMTTGQEIAKYQGEPKRVLFILSTNNNRILAAGSNTAADGIIRLAGGLNAINSFEGYKPLTDEAITVAAPDVILMMSRDGELNHSTQNDELFKLPAIATTPAAKTRSVIRLNGLLLLGFGPRTAEAIKTLNAALYNNVQ